MIKTTSDRVLPRTKATGGGYTTVAIERTGFVLYRALVIKHAFIMSIMI